MKIPMASSVIDGWIVKRCSQEDAGHDRRRDHRPGRQIRPERQREPDEIVRGGDEQGDAENLLKVLRVS
jgi:hypothetical protein